MTFTATVANDNGGNTPTGSVEFFDGATDLGAGTTLSGTGTSTFTSSALTAVTHSITAVFTATGDYVNSTSPIFSQVVDKAHLTVTADAASRIYGSADPIFTDTITGFVLGQNESVVSGTASFSTPGTDIPTSVAGSTYTITVTQGTLSATNYDFTTFNPGTLTVTKAHLTVTADAASRTYGAADPTFTDTITGFVNGENSGVVSGTATFSTPGTDINTSVAGSTYTITPTQGSLTATNYDFTTFNTGTLTVTTSALSITADNQTKVYGAAMPTLTASFSGFVNEETVADLTTQPTLTSTATASSHVSGNPYNITASGAVDSNYTISYVTGHLTVTPAPLTISANNQTKVYGAALPTLTAGYSGLVNGDTSNSLSTKPTLSTEATSGSTVAGSPYTITVGGAVDSDYAISYNNGLLTITPAALTITAANKSMVVHAAVPPLTASYTGFVNGDTSESLSNQPTLNTEASSSSPVGMYAITVGGAADANYNISFVNGILTIHNSGGGGGGTSPPTAAITSEPPLFSDSTMATFDFTGTDTSSGINHLQTELDGAAFTTATSPQTFSGLTEGSHTFEVEAVNNSGTVSAPVSYTWTVDVTAPTITISPPSAAKTTGSPITYTVTYSALGLQAITLISSNITLNHTGTATGTIAVSTVGNISTVTISSIAGNGTLGISIAAGTAIDMAGNLAPAAGPSATARVATTVPPASVGPVIVVGAGAGSLPEVKVYDASTGVLKFDFLAFSSNFRGGVTVATGDVNGDGVEDIIVGGGARVRVFNGIDGSLMSGFLAFNGAFKGGVTVAAGDVNGDGRADIIVGAGAGGGPHVKVFSGTNDTLLKSFLAFSPIFTGGVTVAAGDVDGDGVADIIVGAGPGGGSAVRVFNGANDALMSSFAAMVPSFNGGVTVAAGDVNGDGVADIIVGKAAGAGSRVRVFNGVDDTLLRSFLAFPQNFSGGVVVGSTDANGDGFADIITGKGTGGGPRVSVIGGAEDAVLLSFLAFDPDFTNGISVG